MHEPITRSRVLLVEGKDEVNFFIALLKHMGIGDDVQVLEVGGKDKFPDELPAFLNDPGFPRVRVYAIVRDADKSQRSTVASITGLLRRYKQACPGGTGAYATQRGKTVGIYVLPGNKEQGMLENLCLETVSDHPVMPCVDRFMACLRSSLRHEGRKPSKSQEPVFPKNEVKAKAQAFLAGMREACASVGIAACKGYWNFDHSTLTDLRTFLSKLGPVTRSTAER